MSPRLGATALESQSLSKTSSKYKAMTIEHSPANDDFFGSWVSTNDAMPPPMNQVYACVAYDLSGTKEYAVLEYIPARHHLMQDDPDDQGDADDDGYNWWPKGWYSSLPECGEQTSYDDMRFPINEAEFSVIAWSHLPTYGNPAKTIPGQYTGLAPCTKCGRSHWMHGACESQYSSKTI
jgi:hypothetical protein